MRMKKTLKRRFLGDLYTFILLLTKILTPFGNNTEIQLHTFPQKLLSKFFNPDHLTSPPVSNSVVTHSICLIYFCFI